MERVEEAATRFVEAVGRLNERHGRSQRLEVEVLAILDACPDLTPPAIEPVTPPALNSRAKAALSRVKDVRLKRGDTLPPRLVDVPARTAAQLLGRIKDTPTTEILEAVGHSLDDHDPRYDRAMKAERDRKDAERRDAEARHDEWLREQLADGPVPVTELERRAKEADGIAWAKGDWPHATTRHAAHRIGAFAVEPLEGDRVVHWHCGGKAPDGFHVPEGHARSRAMSAAMR